MNECSCDQAIGLQEELEETQEELEELKEAYSVLSNQWDVLYEESLR